ncbi:hypothetical protein [Synechococcus sp. NB0720_010]|uniref:hypothetical protein n=1 Tax=Synechococcus sp. NB0720_010 TaxID=2907159 RepID=UPI001FFA8D91|nr:hypothetical protein [Synechococcus sp. NB0720_010]UPH89128.1 hypothetical protein LY254_07345 [Synechococcus sp. NB0720_010]
MRQRYIVPPIHGLQDDPRTVRPRIFEDVNISQPIYQALQSNTTDASHWNAPPLAGASSSFKSIFYRCLQTFLQQSNCQKYFKLCTHPLFVELARHIAGAYLNQQHNTMECIHSLTPIRLGLAEGVTEDYIRHCHITLSPTLDVATGEVITHCKYCYGPQ